MEDDEFSAILKQAHEDDTRRRRQQKRSRSECGDVVTLSKEAVAALEERKLHEGVTRAIPTSNVGHKLLVKMGFEGRIGATHAAATAPLPIVVRSARGGLGKDEEALREAREAVDAARRAGDALATQFAARTRSAHEAAAVRRRFRAALKAAHELDGDVPSAWHTLYEERASRALDGALAPGDAEALNAAEEVAENLERCVAYLRIAHHYCFFCGAQYADAAELDQLCPGDTEEAHN